QAVVPPTDQRSAAAAWLARLACQNIAGLLGGQIAARLPAIGTRIANLSCGHFSCWKKEVHTMASSRKSGVGPLGAILLMIVVIFVPIIGHLILSAIILGDDLSVGEKILWLLVIWFLPVVGPLLYLLIGQRRNRLVSQLSY